MSKEALKAWGDDVALRGPDAPKNDGSIKHLIEYLLTVYERFGNTCVTTNLQWGATALHKLSEERERIAELEAQLAARPEEKAMAWIPCSERLPAVGKNLLVVRDDGEVFIDCRVMEPNEQCSHWTYANSDGVTHWMPLPAFPSPLGTPTGCQHRWIYVANPTGQPYWQCDKCLEATNTDPLPSLLPQKSE